MDKIGIHLNLNVNAFKIAFLAAIGWNTGKLVYHVSDRILARILEPCVDALQEKFQEKMYEEKVNEEE